MSWANIAVFVAIQLAFVLAGGSLLRRRIKKLESHMRRETAQVEALMALEKILKLDNPLPPARGWAASADLLRELAEAVRVNKPQTIVECGSGLSTVVLARTLQLNGGGHVYSLDHDADFAQQSRQRLAEYGLSEWASVIHAPLVPTMCSEKQWLWYDTAKLPDQRCDMLVIDGPPGGRSKTTRYPAGPILFARLNAGGWVYLDDARRAEERETAKLWQREFPDFHQRYVKLDKGLLVLRKVAPQIKS